MNKLGVVHSQPAERGSAHPRALEKCLDGEKDGIRGDFTSHEPMIMGKIPSGKHELNDFPIGSRGEQTEPMSSGTERQREYLRHELKDIRGVDLNAASEAIGRNPTYLSQYVKRGVPKHLHEPDRLALVKLYGLDGDRLRPPPKEPKSKKLPSPAGAYGLADVPNQFTDEEFFLLWRRIQNPDVKIAVLLILRSFLTLPDARSNKRHGS